MSERNTTIHYSKCSTIMYVFELSNQKWFLHITTKNDEIPIDEHKIQLECELMYDFVKDNLPILSSKYITINQDLEVDFFVKKYMRYYGIDNVRGGTYTNTNLTHEEHKFITKELNFNLIEECSKQYLLREIMIKYDEIIENQKNNMNELLCEEIQKFNYELNLYNKTKKQLSNINISRNILDDLEWLRARILYYEQNNVVDDIIQLSKKQPDEVKTRYRNILLSFKKVKTNYEKYNLEYYNNNNSIDFNPIIYINRPDIILDYLFYHGYFVSFSHISTNANRIINYYEYMIYSLLNRIDEYEFDLTTFPPDIEKITDYSLKYISKLQRI